LLHFVRFEVRDEFVVFPFAGETGFGLGIGVAGGEEVGFAFRVDLALGGEVVCEREGGEYGKKEGRMNSRNAPSGIMYPSVPSSIANRSSASLSSSFLR
jgi:hypothetical protein